MSKNPSLVNIFCQFLNTNKVSISIGLFLLYFLYQFYFIFFGLDFQDTFFHISRSISNDPFVMTFFTYKVGYWFSLMFGDDVLTFRIFNLILYSFALFITFLLADKKHFKYFLLLILTSFYLALLNWNIFGYDTLSFVFLIFTFVFLMKFIETKKSYYFLFLSLFSALAIVSRLPNLVLIGVVVFSFLLINKSNFQFVVKTISTYLILLAIFISLLVFINYGSFTFFVNQLEQAIKNTEVDHGLTDLLVNYWKHLIKISWIIAFLIGLYIVYYFIQKSKANKFLIALPLIAAIYIYYKKIYGSEFNEKVAFFLTAIMFSLIVIQIFTNITKSKAFLLKENLLMIVILMFIFLPIIGSNTGLKKTAFIIVLFPFLYTKAQFKYKEIFILLLIVLLPLTISEKYNVKFMDKPQNQLLARFNPPKINNIHSTSEKVDRVERILNDCNKIKNNNAICFYGVDSYIFSYLINGGKLDNLSYEMKLNNQIEINNIQNQITKKNHPYFYIVSDEIDINKISEIESKILNYNYQRVFKKDYVVMIPVK